MKNKAVTIVRLFGTIVLITASSLSVGMEYLLETELRVNAQHDDNINLEVDHQDSLYGQTINPIAKMTMRTENWSSYINADLRFPDFNRPGYDSDDQYLDISTSRKGERYDFGLTANVKNDTTRTSEEQDSGRFSNERRNYYSVAPIWSYAITDINLVTLQASLSTADYKDPRYTGYDYGAAYAEWTHIIDEQRRVFIRANTSIYESNGRSADYLFGGLVLGTVPFTQLVEQTYVAKTKATGFQLGASYQWSERLSFFGLFGNSKTDTRYAIETAANQCANSFWLIRGICDLPDTNSSSRTSQASATWEDERDTLSLRYSIATQPSSDGYLLEYQRVDLSWRYRITETGTVNFTTTWGENKELDKPDNQLQTGRSNRNYITVMAGYSHRLTEHWSINANLRYRQQEREIDSNDAEGFGGRVEISYFPDKLQW